MAGRLDLSWFNRYARAAAEWTRERLDDDHRDWLGALPLVREIGDATLVHASPAQPDEWEYLVTAEDGFAAFPALRDPLVLRRALATCRGCGRSARRDPSTFPVRTAVRSEQGRRYIVNVGSVGQPRDRDPRAAYALWDVEAGRVEIRRVAYDVDAARRKIVEAGLPQFLADRLAAGA